MNTPGRVTILVRSIDLRYRSNRAIMFVAAVAGALGLFVVGSGPLEPGWRSAFLLAGATILTWALGRELDPDEPASALVGAVMAIGVTAFIGPVELMVFFGLVAIARVLLRSVGPPPTLLDMAALAVLGVFLGARPGGWPVALVLAFAVARDRTLPGEPARLSRLTALVIAAGSTGVAITAGGVTAGVGVWVGPTSLEWAVVIFGLIAGALIKPIQPLSPTDVGGIVLLGKRLASARRVTLTALLLTVVFAGGGGVAAIGGAFAALVAIFAVQRRILPLGTGPETLSGIAQPPEWASDA